MLIRHTQQFKAIVPLALKRRDKRKNELVLWSNRL
jgi:hypothetical protein